MPREKRIRAVHVPDGVPLPSSPEELAQVIFEAADRKLEREMEGEPDGSAGPVEKREKGD